MNKELVTYYADLICKKLDLELDAFMRRVYQLHMHERENAEYIEKMELEPIQHQIVYLCDKLLSILGKEK